MLIIYTDGASLGNPGPMGIGVVIYNGENKVKELSEYLGEGTNNIAEYTAVIRALESAQSMDETDVLRRSDSQLVVRQLNNVYKVKDQKLRPLKKMIEKLCQGMEVKFEHIPREENKEADALSKEGAKRKRTNQTHL
jgi:ribonuclease HI